MKALLGLCIGLTSLCLRAESTAIELTEALISQEMPQTGAIWQLTEIEGRGKVLELKQSGIPPEQPVRRPANLLLLPGDPLGAFTLELEAKSTVINRKGADIILVFGYLDDTHYDYAHISNDSDNRTHHVIMKVEGDKKTRTPIQNEKDPPATLNGEWQKIKLIRDAEGNIAVFVDDMETPTLTANDPHWRKGKIGIGSFNDPALFAAIELN